MIAHPLLLLFAFVQSWRSRTSSKPRQKRTFIRPSPLTTKREVSATKRINGHAPAPSVTRQRMSRRRLPLDYLDSGDELEKDASDSDEDADRSGVVRIPMCQSGRYEILL
jgi:hypothetical protein